VQAKSICVRSPAGVAARPRYVMSMSPCVSGAVRRLLRGVFLRDDSEEAPSGSGYGAALHQAVQKFGASGQTAKLPVAKRKGGLVVRQSRGEVTRDNR
jgi:hypothetical protein